MQQKVSLRIRPADLLDENAVKIAISQELGIKKNTISGYYLLKKSLDARSRTIWYNLTLNVFIDEPFKNRAIMPTLLQDVHNAAHSVIVVGAGPAGLYAALELIEQGVKPIVLERGKNVRDRRRDLAQLNKEGVVNPESNYCFGEGGAGTYSDGKLYTRSNKRGSIEKALNIFVQFGADEAILYDAHPHIGTNKLPHIISAMRDAIIDCGGEILFEKKLVDFRIEHGKIQEIITSDGDKLPCEAMILATGHSARDIFHLLHDKEILIESKPFALGVRIEHPQELINSIQYCRHAGMEDNLSVLPPASYSLVEQVHQRGVFSFCMCPGGIIAPAATSPEELVVNGWSPSKRNNPYANSGMVVQITNADAYKYFQKQNQEIDINNPLLLMEFQKSIESKAYQVGGGKMMAPAQRMTDFVQRKVSSSLNENSYIPGLNSADLRDVLPAFVYDSLADGFTAFGKKMPGYFTENANVVATESRTSSPVRIPRDKETLQHPQIKNLFPCGEGAGYAGGIISAAMDGQICADFATYYLKREDKQKNKWVEL